jgi:hypothetical protein
MVRPARSAPMIPRRVLTERGLNSGRRPKLRHAAHVTTCHAVTSASSKNLRLPRDQQAGSVIGSPEPPPWKASLLNLLSRMLRRLCKIDH